MKGIYKLALTVFTAAILFFIFNILEFELLNEGMNKNIQSIIFAISAGMAIFYPRLRSKLIYASVAILIVMVVFYLSGNIKLANSIGSLGFGILTITIATYIPAIFKNGYLEKL